MSHKKSKLEMCAEAVRKATNLVRALSARHAELDHERQLIKAEWDLAREALTQAEQQLRFAAIGDELF